MQFQAYFFPDLGIESFVIDLARSLSIDRNSAYRNVGQLTLPTGKESYRYAARALFYLDDITAGFTYYDGFFQLGYSPQLTLSQKVSTRASDKGAMAYFLDGQSSWIDIEVYALEFALHRGDYAWKFESTYFELPDTLDLEILKHNDQLLKFLPAGTDAFFDERGTFINWILDNKQGSLSVTQKIILSAIGLDANFDNYTLNLGLFIFYIDHSDLDKKAIELHKTTFEQDDSSIFGDSNILFAPSLNYIYFLDDQKQNAYGVALGFLNGAGGLIGYRTWEINEAFSLSVSLEYLVLFSSGLVEQTGYELKGDGLYPSFRILSEYKF